MTGDTPTTIQFVNNSNQPVSIYWIDYSGKRVLYAVLQPGQSYVQDTWLSHPWVATNAAGGCLDVFTVSPGRSVGRIGP